MLKGPAVEKGAPSRILQPRLPRSERRTRKQVHQRRTRHTADVARAGRNAPRPYRLPRAPDRKRSKESPHAARSPGSEIRFYQEALGRQVRPSPARLVRPLTLNAATPYPSATASNASSAYASETPRTGPTSTAPRRRPSKPRANAAPFPRRASAIGAATSRRWRLASRSAVASKFPATCSCRRPTARHWIRCWPTRPFSESPGTAHVS